MYFKKNSGRLYYIIMNTIGEETLQIMQRANYYNAWLFSLISPWISGQIAEVGSGMGLFAGKILASQKPVTALDINDDYLKIIKNKYPRIETFNFDLQSPSVPSRLVNKFDTVVAINVLEHVPNLNLALKNIYTMLASGGKLIVLIPSFQSAYGSMDKNLGHYRRYTRGNFTNHLSQVKFKQIFSRYINFWGLWGWWFNGRILKRSRISEAQVGLFDVLFRPWMWLETIVKFPLGLSLVSVSEK